MLIDLFHDIASKMKEYWMTGIKKTDTVSKL